MLGNKYFKSSKSCSVLLSFKETLFVSADVSRDSVGESLEGEGSVEEGLVGESFVGEGEEGEDCLV